MQIKTDNNKISDVNGTEEALAFSRPLTKRSPLAKKLLIKGESLKEFNELEAKIMEESLYQSEIEKILIEKIISGTWKLKRAMEVEKNLMNAQNEISENELYDSDWGSKHRKRIRNIKKVRVNSPELQHIMQYQIELEKGLLKAVQRLREEQKLRLAISKHDQK